MPSRTCIPCQSEQNLHQIRSSSKFTDVAFCCIHCVSPRLSVLKLSKAQRGGSNRYTDPTLNAHAPRQDTNHVTRINCTSRREKSTLLSQMRDPSCDQASQASFFFVKSTHGLEILVRNARSSAHSLEDPREEELFVTAFGPQRYPFCRKD